MYVIVQVYPKISTYPITYLLYFCVNKQQLNVGHGYSNVTGTTVTRQDPYFCMNLPNIDSDMHCVVALNYAAKDKLKLKDAHIDEDLFLIILSPHRN